MNNGMTSHKTSRAPNGTPESAGSSPSAGFKGKEGYRTAVSDTPSVGAGRLSKKYLLELEPRLTDTDWEILKTIQTCRVILGRQVQRLYFTGNKTPQSATRNANRRLKKLADAGLITAANHRMNVRLKGYVAHIYYLTEAGERILQIHSGSPETRRRNIEPSPGTLVHTLSVVECYVQAVEACRAEDMKLVKAELEPDCWRNYQYLHKNYVLKPDLSLVTEKQDWTRHEEPWEEYRWMFEVDLNTESLQCILEKCRRYYDYYKADVEQRLHDDVFPLVVWVVKTECRRQSIIQHISGAFPQFPKIFAVILPDEFHALLRDELKNVGELLCPE